MPPSSREPPSHRFPFESGDRLPLRADVVDLLRRAGVEFFRIPIAPEGEAMKAYFLSPAYIHCHFTPTWVAEEGSALTLLKVFISKVQLSRFHNYKKMTQSVIFFMLQVVAVHFDILQDAENLFRWD